MAELNGIQTLWHELRDGGIKLEVLFAPAAVGISGGEQRPPLLFVHGAFHGAWCWTNFLKFFSAWGHDCYAVSLRGHGGSGEGPPLVNSPGVAGTLASHAADLADLIAALPRAPVLVAHSLGALIAAKYVSSLEENARPPLAGLIVLGGAPPGGNTRTVRRLLLRAPLRMARVAWALATKGFRTSPASCRVLFFSNEAPEETVQHAMKQLAAGGSLALVDSRDRGPANVLPHAPPSPAGWPGLPPERVLVGLGRQDVLVDEAAAQETAAFYGLTTAPVAWHAAHDCQLDAGWEEVARALRQWLATLTAAAGARFDGGTPPKETFSLPQREQHSVRD
eukprot:scaffold6.g2903.t1